MGGLAFTNVVGVDAGASHSDPTSLAPAWSPVVKPENRVLLFCLTLFVAAPALYALGDWLEGTTLAVVLPSCAALGSYAYVRAGERQRAARESQPL